MNNNIQAYYLEDLIDMNKRRERLYSDMLELNQSYKQAVENKVSVRLLDRINEDINGICKEFTDCIVEMRAFYDRLDSKHKALFNEVSEIFSVS